MYVKDNDMIDNNKIEKIIEERKKLHPDDPRVVEKWNELTKILDRKSTRLNSSHGEQSRMPSSA